MPTNAYIAIHGSAVDYVESGRKGRKPRDVDVVFFGLPKEEVELAAATWVSENGLGELPLDLIENSYVPLPPGRIEKMIVLRGDYMPSLVTNHLLPALLRGGGDDTAWSARIMQQWKLGIGLVSCEQEGFSGYCGEGPIALRNALRHVTFRRLRLLKGGLGQFLACVKRAGEMWKDPSKGPSVISQRAAAGLKESSPMSGPGATIHFFYREGRRTCAPHYWRGPNATAMEWWKFITTP